MKNIYIGILATILLLTFVTAGVVTLSKTTSVTFEPKQQGVSNVEIISFNCDGEAILVNGTEADGRWDANDVESAVRGKCSGTISSIVKGGLTYKENKYGFKSFDEKELNRDECSKDGNNWTGIECLEPVLEVGQV